MVITIQQHNKAILASTAFGVDATVRIESANYITWTIDDLQVRAYHDMYANGTGVLGAGSLSAVRIPPRTASQLTLPIDVAYAPSSDPGLAFLRELVAVCATGGGRLPVHLEVAPTIAAAAAFGYRPVIRSDADLPCPPSLGSLLASAGGLSQLLM